VLLVGFSFAQYFNALTLKFLLPPHLFTYVSLPSLGLGYLVDGLIPVLPFVALNYLLVFNRGRHKVLAASTHYTNTTGHAFMWYFAISAAILLGEIICFKAFAN
jgi:hypothetical protein